MEHNDVQEYSFDELKCLVEEQKRKINELTAENEVWKRVRMVTSVDVEEDKVTIIRRDPKILDGNSEGEEIECFGINKEGMEELRNSVTSHSVKRSQLINEITNVTLRSDAENRSLQLQLATAQSVLSMLRVDRAIMKAIAGERTRFEQKLSDIQQSYEVKYSDIVNKINDTVRRRVVAFKSKDERCYIHTVSVSEHADSLLLFHETPSHSISATGSKDSLKAEQVSLSREFLERRLQKKREEYKRISETLKNMDFDKDDLQKMEELSKKKRKLGADVGCEAERAAIIRYSLELADIIESGVILEDGSGSIAECRDDINAMRLLIKKNPPLNSSAPETAFQRLKQQSTMLSKIRNFEVIINLIIKERKLSQKRHLLERQKYFGDIKAKEKIINELQVTVTRQQREFKEIKIKEEEQQLAKEVAEIAVPVAGGQKFVSHQNHQRINKIPPRPHTAPAKVNQQEESVLVSRLYNYALESREKVARSEREQEQHRIKKSRKYLSPENIVDINNRLYYSNKEHDKAVEEDLRVKYIDTPSRRVQNPLSREEMSIQVSRLYNEDVVAKQTKHSELFDKYVTQMIEKTLKKEKKKNNQSD